MHNTLLLRLLIVSMTATALLTTPRMYVTLSACSCACDAPNTVTFPDPAMLVGQSDGLGVTVPHGCRFLLLLWLLRYIGPGCAIVFCTQNIQANGSYLTTRNQRSVRVSDSKTLVLSSSICSSCRPRRPLGFSQGNRHQAKNCRAL